MADDLLITPGSRKLEIKDTSGNVDAKIETDASGNLLITNAGGDISIGDTSSDVFIGDGTNNVDIVFEQNGEIRGTSGVTLTLGAAGSSVAMGTDLSLGGNDLTNVGDITISGNLTVNGTTTTLDSTNTVIEDSIIELNSGLTGTNTKDIGFIFERGTTGNNAGFVWDESADRFTVFTTTDTAASDTVDTSSVANFQAGSFFGNGANLTSLNASNISSGTISDARLPGTISSNITGTAAGLSGTPNITVGTISSGAITATSNSNQIRIMRTDDAGDDWRFYSWADGLNIFPSDEASTVWFGRDGGNTDVSVYNGNLKIGTTTVIDSSKNLTNIGTISSGAISIANSTTAATLLTVGSSSQTNYSLQNFQTDTLSGNTAYLIAYGSGNANDGNFAMKNVNTGGNIFFEVGTATPLTLTTTGASFSGEITAPKFIMTGGSQIGQDYAYLKSNSTSNASLTLRKDSTGADSIDFLQLRSDGNGLIGKIEGDGDISFKNATFSGTISSGAITSSGNIAISAGNKIQLSGAGDGTHHIYHSSSTDFDIVNYSTGFQLEHTSNGTQFSLLGSTGNATFSGGITTSGVIEHTANEGREIRTYMPSSYTTNDIVSGHEYGWYSDYWRVGISRSGNTGGEAFRFNYSGSYVAQIGTTGIFDGTGYRVNGTTIVDSSRNLTNIGTITQTTNGEILDASANLTNINNIYANGYRIGSTTVIDSSRNLTNIGTITSGAIDATSSAEEVIRVNTTGNTAAIHWRDSDAIRGLMGFSNGSSIWTGADDHDMVIRSQLKLHLVSDVDDLGITINGGNATFGGTVSIPHTLDHVGDTDTYVKFDDNRVRIVNGNNTYLDTNNGSSVLHTGTTFSGDISGTYNAIVISNDSHTHAFNNLTSKTSGTGEYSTSGYLTAGRGGGGVSLTHNDGYGNANVTFNHKSGVPEQNGNSARIEVPTDSSTDCKIIFGLNSGVTSGVAIQPVDAMTIRENYVDIRQYLRHMADDDTYLSFTTDRIRLYAGGALKIDTNNTYLTGITSSDVTTALGYTPYQESTALSASSITASSSITMNGTGDFVMDRTDNGFSFVVSSAQQTAGRDVIFQAAGGGEVTGCDMILNFTNISIPNKIYHTGDGNTYMQFNNADEWRVVTGGTERLQITNSETVINDDSNDYDFRVESNNLSGMLFVDGGNDKVAIGTTDTASMDGRFTVQGDSISSTDGDIKTHAVIAGSRHHLDFEEERTANTSDWQNTIFRLGMRVDTTDHQAIEFYSDGSSNEHIDIRTGNRVFNTRFHANGNVGIGTGSPSFKLDVTGDIRSGTGSNSPSIIIDKSTSGVGSLLFNNAGGTKAKIILDPSEHLRFYTGSTNAVSERLTILEGGNVGINDNNPATTLDVGGTIRCNNEIQFADDTMRIFKSSNTMTFRTNSANRMTLDGNGVLKIGSSAQDLVLPVDIVTGGGELLYDAVSNGSGTDNKFLVGHIRYSNSGSSAMQFIKQNFTGMGGSIEFYCSPANTTLTTVATTHKMAVLGPTGDFAVDGDLIAYSTSTGSDIKLKENIRDLEGSLDKTLKLRGVKYDWKEEKRPNDQIGFIAQEVQEVVPEVVDENQTLTKEGETHLTVNYPALVPMLVEAIKEQQTIINRLEERLNSLENKGEK